MTLKHELELKEKKLLLYEEMLKAGYGKEEITHKTGISRPTFYRWKRRYRDQGIKGLKDLSHRPHRSLKDKNGLLLAPADYMCLKQSHML